MNLPTQTRRHLRREMKPAFTLIELLIAVGIIAVLAALFLPALGFTRKMASSTVCVSNLRQIYQLSVLWSADNDGFVPQGRWEMTNLPSNYKNLIPYGLTPKLMTCPAAGLKAPTYGISSRLVTGSPQWGPGDVYYYSHGKYKLSLLSPRTVFFSETAKQSWSGSAGAYISAPEYAATPHFGKGNVLFADGHVETLATNELKRLPLWTNGIP